MHGVPDIKVADLNTYLRRKASRLCCISDPALPHAARVIWRLWDHGRPRQATGREGRMVYDRQGGEGHDPLIHMGLLATSPERVLALRLALSSVVRPSSSVLEAGCGSLGIMAIIAAKLGARRVVAVDFGRLDLARALAEQNGVASRIEFIESDLTELDGSIGTFDVIVGMIYNNEPRSDFTQQQIIISLARRFGRAGAAIIPDRVRYSVSGYDFTGPDVTGRTSQSEWEETVERIEGQAGISLAGVPQLTNTSSPPRSVDDEWSRWLSQGTLAGRFGYPDRRAVRQLTERALFAEINYNDSDGAAAYPPSVALAVTQPGRLDTAIWRQDLAHGDLLIRSTETRQPLVTPQDVLTGDEAILSTADDWGDAIPLTVRRPGQT